MKLDRTQCVYVIHNPELNITKIGISENAERRLKDLQCACGCELVLFYNTEHLYNATLYESLSHTKLAEKRKIGEWFSVSPEEAMSVVIDVTKKAPKDSILNEYKNGIPISRIASKRGVSRQAIISRLSLYGMRMGDDMLLKHKNKPQRHKRYDIKPEHVNAPIKQIQQQPNITEPTEINIEQNRIPKERFLDEDRAQLPLFKLKRIEPNIYYNGEWYQTSFYSEGEFCHGYTKDLEKARQYIVNLKKGR